MCEYNKETEALLDSIYKYILSRSQNDIIPTIREICDYFNINSTSTVHRYINILCDRGLIQKKDSRNRALKVTRQMSRAVPVIGTVCAGMPMPVQEDIQADEFIYYTGNSSPDDVLFALKIKGESMINAGIFENDTVIVKKQSYAENGDIVIALIDDETTIKTFYFDSKKKCVRLQPENDFMEPIYTNNAAILGKVIGLNRTY